MITSAELTELRQLVKSEHHDPHHILGMHSIMFNGKKILTVRAFIPQAKCIEIFDPLLPDKLYPMEKVHIDGFFEGMIDDRDKWFRYMLRIESTDGNCWTTYDSYSFFPTINETDRYLFCEGTHYEIFNKLGAHLTELEGISGAAFAVWAPNAVRVSVIGEFNCWDGRRNQMRNLSGSGIWEIFVPGLKELDEYKYEILTKSGAYIQKSDPYAFYMAQSPGTQSILFDIDKYKWNDGAWLEQKKERPQLDSPVNIYELHIGSWMKPFGYRELAESLVGYVKNAGYTHIGLLPVQEHSDEGALGYLTTGYYAPASKYGKPDELMYLIDKCHQENIGVIIDWVPIHFPSDHFSLVKFDGTALYEHADPRLGVHPVWGTNMFDFARKEVKNFLLGNALFWIEKYHVDGLRINNLASALYLDYGRHGNEWMPNILGGNENLDAIEFIKHLNSIIEKNYADTLMIAEDTALRADITLPVENGGLGFDLVWNLGWMKDFLTYMTEDYDRRPKRKNTLPHFFSHMYNEKHILTVSHDEVAFKKPSILNRMPGDPSEKMANLRLGLTLMMGHPGRKLSFMGLEFGQLNVWDIAKSLDWDLLRDEEHIKLAEFVRDLNEFYKKEKSLWELDFIEDGFEWIRRDANISVFIRKSHDKKDITVFACNFGKIPVSEYRIDLPHGGSYVEIINSDLKIYGGGNTINDILNTSVKKNPDGNYALKIKLPALAAIVLKPGRASKKS